MSMMHTKVEEEPSCTGGPEHVWAIRHVRSSWDWGGPSAMRLVVDGCKLCGVKCVQVQRTSHPWETSFWVGRKVEPCLGR
jgi:hypothetical protein